MMSDPTYNREIIKANPVWDLAFVLSEIQNDAAPLGWGKYIYVAKCLLGHYEIKERDSVVCLSNGTGEIDGTV